MIFKKEFVENCLTNRDSQFELGKQLAYCLNLKSCVDFSCGIGSVMSGLVEGGCKEVVGYEYWDLSQGNIYTEIPSEICQHIKPGDYTQPIKISKQYDCAICINATKINSQLIETLCNASNKYIYISGVDPLDSLKTVFKSRGFNCFSKESMNNTYITNKDGLILVKDASDKKLVVRNSFGNYPKIFHHHGRPSLNGIGYNLKRDFCNVVAYNATDFYRDIKSRKPFPKIVNKKNSGNKKFNEKVTIAHVSNYKETGSCVDCMNWLGYESTTLGQDIVDFKHINKLERLCEFVKNEVQTEYTLYIDDPDVFVIDELDDIIDKFEAFKCQFLFQADGWMYPRGFPKKLYDYFVKIAPMETPHKFLNSGAFMFKTEYYKGIIPKLLEKESYNSNVCQSVYINLFQKEYPNMKLDYYSQIFQSTAYSKWFEDRYGTFDLKIEIKTK